MASRNSINTVTSSEFPPRGDACFLRKTIAPGVTQKYGGDLNKNKKLHRG